ncbi:hypothetical protein [Alteraurantiacibacter palmitatis]|uniref:DUF2306 domain-containing protein n=1 Tax=Alteraurantiacibacter palmitatis TaxID=2054628 RepID=A0ABV7E8V3_9SPHN
MQPATALARRRAETRFRPSFSLILILAMCLFVFGGFGMHSALPALRGDFPPAPPIVHLHGAVYVSWMLLLVVQSALVNTGRVKLHRALGLWGIAHASAIMMLGLFLQLIASRAGMDAGRDPGTDGLYLGLLAFAGFSILFALAIRNAKVRPQVHRSLILLAMLPVLPPGVNRFWFRALELDDPIPTFWLYLTLWSMAAAILWNERRSTGRISGATLFGAGWIVAQGAVHEAVVGSAWFDAISRAVLSLAVYR